jgi:hypothetical protein
MPLFLEKIDIEIYLGLFSSAYLSGVKIIMAAAKMSMIVSILSVICFVIQVIISAVIFEDSISAILASGFVILMIFGSLASWKGGMSAVTRELYSYDQGGHSRVTVYEDTGQRIQCTPCFGICSGIASLIVIVMIGGELFGLPEFVLLAPGILGALLAIVAGILFVIEYKGPYTAQV